MNSFDLFGNPITSDSLSLGAQEERPGFVFPTDELGETIDEDRQQPRRFFGMGMVVTLVTVLLATQCFRLQVQEGSVNQALAEGNSIRLLTLQADRGLIVDMNGSVLAQNTRELALAINPTELPSKKADRQAVYSLLKEKAGIDDQAIAKIEENRTLSPDTFVIKTKLTKDESLLYQEWFNDTPGVVVEEFPIRQYAELPSLGQLIGYVGQVDENDLKNGYTRDQQVGKAGLESSYNTDLMGVPGKQKAEVNAYGEIVRMLPGESDLQPKAGKTLKLSIDSNLQKIVADALKHELERRTKKFGQFKTLGASAVVLDPSTGAVKAMVSLPDYSASIFAGGISQKQYSELINNPANPLLNRTIQGQFPSGSVIKPPIAAAGLQTGVIKPDTQMVTPDAIRIGGFSFPDWKVHGLTNTRKAIAESNDIFFYAVGGGWQEKNFKGMGVDTLNKYLGLFGFGSPLGIDLAGEASGLVPTPDWKQKKIGEPWYIGDTYHSSIGQGFTLVTPLQIAAATAAIANGGTVWQPKVGWSTVDVATGKETLIQHEAVHKDFISPENLKVVREGMRQTVTDGSARPLNGIKVTSAGKTGSAEFGDPKENLVHAWYTGFAPYENPEIAFSILIEGGGESFYSSVPVAEEILRNYFGDPLKPGQKLNADTDLNNLTQYQGER